MARARSGCASARTPSSRSLIAKPPRNRDVLPHPSTLTRPWLIRCQLARTPDIVPTKRRSIRRRDDERQPSTLARPWLPRTDADASPRASK